MVIRLERNVNSFCLLVGSHKKPAQFPSSLFLPGTFLLKHFPLFSLVDSLMLLKMYVSHTISSVLEFLSCMVIYGIKTSLAYSSNVTTLVVGSRCTTAAPSTSITSKEFGRAFWVSLVRMFSKSDLFSKRNFPQPDSRGGKRWFSIQGMPRLSRRCTTPFEVEENGL